MAASIVAKQIIPDVGTATFTLSVNNANASPMYVIVPYQGSSISGVTFNGDAFSSMGASFDSAGVVEIQAWKLLNPDITTANVVVTFLAAPNGGAVPVVVTTSGVDQTSGNRTLYTRTDSDGTGPGLTVVDSQNGDIVLHGAAVYAATITFDGGESATSNNNHGGSGYSAGVSEKAATGANTAVGCADVATYVELAFALIPSAGGSTVAMGGSAVTGGSGTNAPGITIGL